MGHRPIVLEKEQQDLEPFKCRVVDATELYLHGIEDNFQATANALRNLRKTRTRKGTAWIFRPHIDPEMLEGLINIADWQEFLPIHDGMMGVDMIEPGAQVWKRMLLLTFKGTRLWSEIIEPNFDHVLFGSILMDKTILDAFVFDIEAPDDFDFGVNTEATKRAKIIHDLIRRMGLDSGMNIFGLHMAIVDQIREELGIQSPDEDNANWDRLYIKYWLLNDHQLISPEMVEFMKGRTLVTVDVDLPIKYTSERLEKTLLDQNFLDYLLKGLHTSKKARSKFFGDIFFNFFADRILSDLTSLILIGGRDIGKKNIAEYVKSQLKKIKSKYTFVAAVRDEFLVRV